MLAFAPRSVALAGSSAGGFHWDHIRGMISNANISAVRMFGRARQQNASCRRWVFAEAVIVNGYEKSKTKPSMNRPPVPPKNNSERLRERTSGRSALPATCGGMRGGLAVESVCMIIGMSGKILASEPENANLRRPTHCN